MSELPSKLPQERATPAKGTAHVNSRKYERAWPPNGSHSGDIHIGMMGVSVINPDGSVTLYPWRVIDRVDFDPAP